MHTSADETRVSLASVMFATDFSESSMQALPYALGISSQYGSKLYLAHVIPIEPYLMGDPKAADRLRQARQEANGNLADVLDSLSNRGIPIQALVDNGDIWMVMSDFIRKHTVDLLVIGTTGRTGLGKVLLGSVAEEAIRESPCPVLAVGPKAPHDATMRVRKVLFATDFSAVSLLAVPYALSFAEKFRAHLTLLHVIVGLPDSPYVDAQMARVRLRELVKPEFDFSGAPEIIVEMGSAADMILSVARDTAAHLIIMGVRGAGALARLATHFGSIAHKVISHAPSPVLTVGRSREELEGREPQPA